MRKLREFLTCGRVDTSKEPWADLSPVRAVILLSPSEYIIQVGVVGLSVKSLHANDRTPSIANDRFERTPSVTSGLAVLRNVVCYGNCFTLIIVPPRSCELVLFPRSSISRTVLSSKIKYNRQRASFHPSGSGMTRSDANTRKGGSCGLL